ncbi:MAG: deoxyribose-phosphate aldolase [Saprospiraceae bacterium]|nr:deoxyribose-phosphate aldolase [Saprospiraceae bacterium]
MDKNTLAGYIDHTLLKPTASLEEIFKLCDEALEHHFCSVCIAPYFVEAAAKRLENSDVKVCTVIGFPLGYQLTTLKIDEIKRALNLGVNEIDAVVNVSAVKSGDWDWVEQEIASIATTASIKDLTSKIIFETCYLTEAEVIKLCELCTQAGVNYVKTSTGFGSAGATVEMVKLMKAHIGKKMKVKASGGIRTYEDAMKMIEAGAERLGASAGVSILSGIK